MQCRIWSRDTSWSRHRDVEHVSRGVTSIFSLKVSSERKKPPVHSAFRSCTTCGLSVLRCSYWFLLSYDTSVLCLAYCGVPTYDMSVLVHRMLTFCDMSVLCIADWFLFLELREVSTGHRVQFLNGIQQG